MVAHWDGASVVIIASGPSLTIDDCELVREWREATGGKCVAINTSYQRALWADVLYACDNTWWDGRDARGYVNVDAAKRDFRGELWTQDKSCADAHGLRYIKSVRAEGLSRSRDVVHQGFNSGYQAINLAYNFGARRIALLGFDMTESGGKTHWHKPHAHETLANKINFENCLQEFKRLAVDLAAAGVVTVNCTRRTALHSFPPVSLEQELAQPVLMAAD